MTATQQQINPMCSQFFEEQINKIAAYLAVPENLKLLEAKQPQDIVVTLRQMAGQPAPPPGGFQVPPQANFGLPPSMPAFNPALGQFAAGATNMLQVSAPPAPTKKSSSRNVPHNWQTVEVFKAQFYMKAAVCSYRPSRGPDEAKGKVCCNPAESYQMEPNPLKWRCKYCKDKQGTLDKVINTVTPSVAPISGFNIPNANYGAMNPVSIPATGGPPTMPSMLPFPSAPNTTAPGQLALPTGLVAPQATQALPNPTFIGGLPPATLPAPNLPTSVPGLPPAFGLPPAAGLPPPLAAPSLPAPGLPAPSFTAPGLPPSAPSAFTLPMPASTATPGGLSLPLPGLPPVSLPALPPSNFSLPAPLPVPTLEQKLPEVTIHAPPALPTASPALSALQAPVAQQEETTQIDAIQTQIAGLYVTANAQYPGLALKEEDGNLYCIGKLDVGAPITASTPIPDNWQTPQYLKDANDTEKAYLQRCQVEYEYSVPQTA